MEGRFENRAELLQVLGDAFARRTTSEWLEVLLAARVPCSPVNDVEAALADPQSVARGVVVEIQDPSFGSTKQIASPLRFVGTEQSYVRGPQLGEHTAEVLANIAGLSSDEVAALMARRT
jgi:crotonobetainyl-CoA:carnitine CoA-transferase CaiB-like acyl-CoA transferase